MDRVRAYLVRQESALISGEAAVHAGDRSAVHRARVGARRARSTLQTFAGLFVPEPRDRAVVALREYAGRLAPVRDLQVLRETLAAHGDGEADQTLLAWALGEVDARLDAVWPSAARTVRPAPATRLAAIPGEPGVGARSEQDCFARAARKAERRLGRAGDDPERLHAARKAAKRARYAAEALGMVDEASRFESAQDALGAHRDLVTAADWLEASAPPPLVTAAAAIEARLRRDAADARRRAVL